MKTRYGCPSYYFWTSQAQRWQKIYDDAEKRRLRNASNEKATKRNPG